LLATLLLTDLHSLLFSLTSNNPMGQEFAHSPDQHIYYN
jgi:hypothetical protein